jgi:Lrp/AsnC family transcriptional regulator, leucine-responsive regulatory protein
VELDEFDRRLLQALQQDSRRTGEQLAALVGLSPAACLRRVQRLRAAGIIEREVAIVAPRAVGRRLSIVLQVTLIGERAEVFEDFKRRMRRAPEVLQCYNVTGVTDFIVILAVADMEAYDAFIQRVMYGDVVRRFEAMVVIERVKFETALPIAAELVPEA